MDFKIGRKNILAVCGSTRADSTNLNFILAIKKLFEAKLELTIFNTIAELPHFNPDINSENIPEAVHKFKALLDNSEGVLICTPEYAHGVPGSLKNAIDWCVSSNNFFEKPTALITASTEGVFAHSALLETLKVIQCQNIENLNLVIPFAKTKINEAHSIIDETTLNAIKKLINDFLNRLS